VTNLLGNLRRWSSREKLLAVSGDELEEWLASLGILEALQAGEVACFVCGEQVGMDTLQLASRVKGEIVVCCIKPSCVRDFAQVVKEKNV